MATLASVPTNKTTNNTSDYDVNTFWINNEAQDNGYQFRPAKAFNDVDAETVLKIITKANLSQAKTANKKGNINFILSKPDKNRINRVYGYLNNVENDLTIDSDAELIADTLFSLEQELNKVKLTDITQPMTVKDAEDMLAML
jgi:hypothetical protein